MEAGSWTGKEGPHTKQYRVQLTSVNLQVNENEGKGYRRLTFTEMCFLRVFDYFLTLVFEGKPSRQQIKCG